MVLVLMLYLIYFGCKSVSSSAIELNECPCMEESGCPLNSPGENSTFWRKFGYENNVSTTFTLRKGSSQSCPTSESFFIDFSEEENAKGDNNGWLEGFVENSTKAVLLMITETGVLILWDRGTGREEYNPEAFCIQKLNESHSVIKTCCGLFEKSCVRKCCPIGYAFTQNHSSSCAKVNSEAWQPAKFANNNGMASNPVKMRTDFPNCHPSNQLTLSTSLTKMAIPRSPFRLAQDGTVQFLDTVNFHWKDKPEVVDYCIDTVQIPADKVDLTCGSEEQDVLIMCVEPPPEKASSNVWIYRLVYMAGFCISIVFLLITATVHFLLWEKQNIHAWTILCYVMSLTGFYSCLLIIYLEEVRKRLSPTHNSFISPRACYAIGLVTHFLGVLAFSWLSVINFDLWWTFRVLKPMNQRSFDWKRLIAYASFALGVPTVVVTVSVVLQLSYEAKVASSVPCRHSPEDPTVFPMYGHETCFLGNASQPFYFYLPVGVLLFSNLVFYLCTSCQMLRIYNATRRLSDRSTRKQKQSCELFFKLFLVMGTTWIFQLILAFVEKDAEVLIWHTLLYAALDLSNIFQAVAIFVIFVCKRETLRALEQKYSCLRRCLHPCGGVYQVTPLTMSRSTDGSTKLSRTELTKTLSIDSYSNGGCATDRRRDSDSEMLRFS